MIVEKLCVTIWNVSNKWVNCVSLSVMAAIIGIINSWEIAYGCY